MNTPVFRLREVSLAGGVGRWRLRRVYVDIPPGVTAVVGASGAGKSSLLEVLAGFATPSSGVVERGAPPSGDGEAGGLFWLPADLGLWPSETVEGHLRAVQPEPDHAAVEELLSTFGLESAAARRPGLLSAGERSRLAVARAIASRADVLLLDEPLAHVDPASLPRYWARLREALAECRAAVFVTHDPVAAVWESTHCIAVADRTVTWSGATETLYRDPPEGAPAELLGPVSVLPPSVAERLGLERSNRPAKVRSGRLDLIADPDGSLLVESSHPAGPLTETVVTPDPPAEPFSLLHRTGPPLAKGARAALRFAFLLLAGLFPLLGAGCDGGPKPSGPALSFAEVRVRATPNAGAQLPAPRGVGIGPNGEAFVLDDAGRVLVFAPDGEELRRWDMPSNVNGNPEGICVYRPPGSEEWLVAVADTHFHRIVLFTTEGEEVVRWGVEGDEPGDFRFPVAVTADDAGRLYVGEYGGNDRVQVFSPHPENRPLREFGSFGTGPGQFSRASGVAWVPPEREGKDAFVLVADAFGDRIARFTDQGEYRGVLGGDDAVALHSPYDLARAADGTLWVPEYHGGRVTALRPDGTLIGRWSRDEKAGALLTPWGLDVDAAGRVWVADTGNRRLVTLVP
ncbi:ATP-binding cassette domain-containing protein [Alienimonas chondri]|uniref:ABC transporter domain-containing protein n=1 Tax=Alienimonas chondri TaxID=2681879 RepID=A0ABX1VBY5_9PLAN|nr:ATP-binding cassette domain-containing protein [Alienimonas chondri]NNJ25617.1 hypothetical protein [Alienimonas chondri]